MEDSEFSKEKHEQALFYKAVGSKIKGQRVEMRLTQEDLGYVFNISRVSINNIETGKQRLPLHLLVAIAEFLFIPLPELVPKYSYKIKTRKELKEHKIKIATDKISI